MRDQYHFKLVKLIESQAKEKKRKINDKADSKIRRHLKTKRKFKEKIENMPKLEFVNNFSNLQGEAARIGDESYDANVSESGGEEASAEADSSDYVEGKFQIASIKERLREQLSTYSQPISSEGVVYRMLCRTGNATWLEMGLARDKLPCLKIDTSDEVTFRFEMVHPSDESKTFKKSYCIDMSRHSYGKHYPVLFYKKDKLERDGFIHQDGSLNLRFFVKKNKFQERALLAEAKVSKLLAKRNQ